MPRGSNYRPAAQAELAGWGSSDRLEFRYSADHAQEGSVSSFDVRVFAIRRRPGCRVFEVRWRVAGCDKFRSFITRALADSYRAELIRAARRGLEFDPATGEPLAWAAPAPATVTWSPASKSPISSSKTPYGDPPGVSQTTNMSRPSLL